MKRLASDSFILNVKVKGRPLQNWRGSGVTRISAARAMNKQHGVGENSKQGRRLSNVCMISSIHGLTNWAIDNLSAACFPRAKLGDLAWMLLSFHLETFLKIKMANRRPFTPSLEKRKPHFPQAKVSETWEELNSHTCILLLHQLMCRDLYGTFWSLKPVTMETKFVN